MNAQVKIATAPQMLTLFRGMSDYDRHRAIQLMLREFPYAEDEADIFLAAAAEDLLPNNAGARDDLYPTGSWNMEASRLHRVELERKVVAAERYASGRAGMMAGRTEPMPATAAAWRAF